MTDTITKERLEEVLEECGFNIKGNRILELAFPPKFQPREGQVIAGWDDDPDDWDADIFQRYINDEKFICKYACKHLDYKNARPLTVEEIT